MHTPGPWRWDVSTKQHFCRLETVRHGGDIVMDFVRWGMSSAAPRFADDSPVRLLQRVDELALERRSHHKGWDQWINHPDAFLIAAAPDLLEALELLYQLHADGVFTLPDKDYRAITMAAAAIAKAKPVPSASEEKEIIDQRLAKQIPTDQWHSQTQFEESAGRVLGGSAPDEEGEHDA